MPATGEDSEEEEDVPGNDIEEPVLLVSSALLFRCGFGDFEVRVVEEGPRYLQPGKQADLFVLR